MIAFTMKDGNLNIDPATWGLLPFKAILKNDKSRNKEIAFKEVLFIYYYCDVRSDYMSITDDNIRTKEIIKDIKLPEDWKINQTVKEAIIFYESKSITPTAKLYKSALKAADDISKYLESTRDLLEERTSNGGTVTKIGDITGALSKVPGIMRDLKSAHKEVIQEQKELEGRTKGSRTLGLFEEGLTID